MLLQSIANDLLTLHHPVKCKSTSNIMDQLQEKQIIPFESNQVNLKTFSTLPLD